MVRFIRTYWCQFTNFLLYQMSCGKMLRTEKKNPSLSCLAAPCCRWSMRMLLKYSAFSHDSLTLRSSALLLFLLHACIILHNLLNFWKQRRRSHVESSPSTRFCSVFCECLEANHPASCLMLSISWRGFHHCLQMVALLWTQFFIAVFDGLVSKKCHSLHVSVNFVHFITVAPFIQVH